MSKWEIAKDVIKLSSPLTWLVITGAEKATEAMNNSSTRPLPEFQEEAARQQIKMQIAQSQARIEQELAIAKRIENAEKVEIEEFYDLSGKGSLGLTVDAAAETASLGVGAEGRRITKRVYRFDGWRKTTQNEVEL